MGYLAPVIDQILLLKNLKRQYQPKEKENNSHYMP